MFETWVRSLGQEDPLEKEMATHSSILGWEIPRTEEPGGLLSMGPHRVGHNLGTKPPQPISPANCYFFIRLTWHERGNCDFVHQILDHT